MEEVFQLGTNRKAQIISSLENSGLGLTSSSSWNQIIAVLANRFPAKLNLLLNFTGYFQRNSGSTGSVTSSGFSLPTTSISGYQTVTFTTKEPIDITNFKTLIVTGTDVWWTDGTQNSNISITLTCSGTTTTVYSRSGSYKGSHSQNISKSIDVSSLTGDCSFTFTYYYYAVKASQSTSFTQFEFSV